MSRFRDSKFRLPSVLAVLVAACALSFGLVACGSDDDSTDTAAETSADETTAEASAEKVTLTAVEYEFNLSATPTADTKEITFQNDGKMFHVMVFARLNEGFTLAEAIKLQGEKGSATTIAEAEAPPGKSVTVKTKGPITAGDYAMLCPIGGPKGPHYELGQLQEFSIE